MSYLTKYEEEHFEGNIAAAPANEAKKRLTKGTEIKERLNLPDLIEKIIVENICVLAVCIFG